MSYDFLRIASKIRQMFIDQNYLSVSSYFWMINLMTKLHLQFVCDFKIVMAFRNYIQTIQQTNPIINRSVICQYFANCLKKFNEMWNNKLTDNFLSVSLEPAKCFICLPPKIYKLKSTDQTYCWFPNLNANRKLN